MKTSVCSKWPQGIPVRDSIMPSDTDHIQLERLRNCSGQIQFALLNSGDCETWLSRISFIYFFKRQRAESLSDPHAGILPVPQLAQFNNQAQCLQRKYLKGNKLLHFSCQQKGSMRKKYTYIPSYSEFLTTLLYSSLTVSNPCQINRSAEYKTMHNLSFSDQTCDKKKKMELWAAAAVFCKLAFWFKRKKKKNTSLL